MRVGSLGMISGCSVTEFFCNKIANWFWIITYNSKELVQLHAFDHFVDDQCLCHQPKDGTKSGQSVKNEECHNYNEQVAEQQSGGNVHRGVLFDDHGDDVCPASGGVLEKEQGSCDCRQQDRKAKLQRNLIGQRS